jgi:hypothetical protein
MFGPALLLPGLPKSLAWLDLVLLPMFWFVAVAFHELGHLVGGWIGRGRFLLYVAGPFMWSRSPAGVSFSWNRNINMAGGLAACLPLDPAHSTPRRTALIFAVTVFPATGGGFKTNGLRFLELNRGDARSAQENAVMTLTTAALRGVRPADYDPRLVEQAIALGDRSLFDLYGHLTAAPHFIDTASRAGPNNSSTMSWLARIDSRHSRATPCAATTRGCSPPTPPMPPARAWLDTAGPLDFDPATRLRAEAAVLLAEGKNAEAAAKAREGLHAVEHKSLSPVKSVFAEEALQEIVRRASC